MTGRRCRFGTLWLLTARRLLVPAGMIAALLSSEPAIVAASAATAPPAGYTAAGLYNLANAYARAGKPGLAVLNYERARLLAPGDPDLEANERHVREALHIPSPRPATVERLLDQVPPGVAAWVGVLGVLIGGTALVVGAIPSRAIPPRGNRPSAGAARDRTRLARRRNLRNTALWVAAGAILLPVCQGALLWPTLREGVVVAGTAPVLVSPVPMGDPLFSLGEAEAVTITARHEGYVLIRTAAGRSGWVALTTLVPVVPANHGITTP